MKWEYRVESYSITSNWSEKKQAQSLIDFNNKLNQVGGEGWELISYETVPMFGSFSGNQKGAAYLLFMKRPA